MNTFCPERNIKLATYASRCIENEILMFLRKHSQLRNEVSIDDPLNVDWDGNELLLSDVLGSDQDAVNVGVEQESERKLLLRAVSRLPPRDRKIMELRFGLGKRREHTQKEVADRLGIFPILYFPPGKENSETSFGRIWSMRAEEESGEKRSLCRKSVSFLQKNLRWGCGSSIIRANLILDNGVRKVCFTPLRTLFCCPAEGGPYHAVEYEATGGSLLLFPAVVGN